MEGNTLTKQETQKLLHYGITAKGKPLRDHIEIQGHDKALKKLERIVHKDLKFSESLIKGFHKMILAEPVSLLDENVEINPGRILMNLILMQNDFMPTIVPLTSRNGYY